MKGLVFLGITIGGLLGGYLGSVFDHGNPLGVWGILLGTVGSLAGIWAAVRANDYL